MFDAATIHAFLIGLIQHPEVGIKAYRISNQSQRDVTLNPDVSMTFIPIILFYFSLSSKSLQLFSCDKCK